MKKKFFDKFSMWLQSRENTEEMHRIWDYIQQNYVLKSELEEIINTTIDLLSQRLRPLQEEYDREYRLWFDGIRTDKRRRLLKEYEEGAKGNIKFSLQERIDELKLLKSKYLSINKQ